MVREIPKSIIEETGKLAAIAGGEVLEKAAFGTAEMAEESVKGAGGWIKGTLGPSAYAQIVGALEANNVNLSKEELDTFATGLQMGIQGGLAGLPAGPLGALAGGVGGFALGAGLGANREVLTQAQEGFETKLKSELSNKTAGNIAEFLGQVAGYYKNPGGVTEQIMKAGAKKPIKTSSAIGGGIGFVSSGQMVSPEQSALEKLKIGAIGAAGGAALGAALPPVITGLGNLGRLPQYAGDMMSKAQEIVSKMNLGKKNILEKSAVVKSKIANAEQAAQTRMQTQAQAMEAQYRAVQEGQLRKQQEMQELIRSQQAEELRPVFQELNDLGELEAKMMAQKTSDQVVIALLEAPNAETIFKDKSMAEVQRFVDMLVGEDFARTAKQNQQKTQFRTLMRQNMERARQETVLGDMERQMESLEQQKQDILKAVHPEAYVPETEYQKGLKQNISQIQDELNRVVEASIAGDDLPDIPVVRELKEQQAIAIKEARQSALTQVSDEINQLQDELAKIKEQNYDTFNNKFKTPKISYDEARRGKLSPEVEYNQKAQQLQELMAQQRKLESELVGDTRTPQDLPVEGNDVQRILRERMTAEELKLSNTRKGQLTKARKKYGQPTEEEILPKLAEVEAINKQLQELRTRYLGTLQETAKLSKAATEKQIDAIKKSETAPLEQLVKGTPTEKRLPKNQIDEMGNPEIEIKVIDEPISAEGEPFTAEDLRIIEIKGKGTDTTIEIIKTPEGETIGAKVKNPSKLNKEISQAERNPQTKTEKIVEGNLEQVGDEVVYKAPPHRTVERALNNQTKPIISLLEERGLPALTKKVDRRANANLMIENRLEVEIVSEINNLTKSSFKSWSQLKNYLKKQFQSKSDLVFANSTYEDMGLDKKTIDIIEALNAKLSSLADIDFNGTKIKDISGWQDIENYIPREVADYEGLLEAMKLSNKEYKEMIEAVNKAFAEGTDPTLVVKNFQKRKNLNVTPEMQKFYSDVGDAYEHKFRRMYRQMADLEFFEGKLGKDAPAISDTIKSFIEREAPGLEDFKKQEIFDATHALFTVDPIGVTDIDSLFRALNHTITAFALSDLPTAGLQIVSTPRFAGIFGMRAFFSSFKHLFNKQFTGHDFSKVVSEFSDLSAKSILQKFDEIALLIKTKQYGKLAKTGLEKGMSIFSDIATSPMKLASSRFELPIGMGSAFEDFVLKSKQFVKQQANGGEVDVSLRNFIQRIKLLHGEKEALRLLRKFGNPDYKFDKTQFDEYVLYVAFSQVRDLGAFALSKADVAPALAETKTVAAGATVLEVIGAHVQRNMARFTSFTAKAGGVLRRKIIDEFKAGNPVGAFRNIAGLTTFMAIVPMMGRYVGKLAEVSLSADMAGIEGEGKKTLLKESATREFQDRLAVDSFFTQFSPVAAMFGGRVTDSTVSLITEGDIQGFATAALDMLAVKGGGQALQTIGNTSATMLEGLNPLDPVYNPSARHIPFKWAGRINESIIDPSIKGVGAAKFERIHKNAERVRSQTPLAKDLREYDETNRMIESFAALGYDAERIQEELKNRERAKRKTERIKDKSYVDFVSKLRKN